MLTRYLAGAAAAVALLTAAPAAVAQASGLISPSQAGGLHQARLAAVPSTGPAPISGIVYPQGVQPPTAPQAAGCNKANCPLTYHGGPVQRHPRVYLLLWGPKWKHSAAEAAVAAYLRRFYTGLGRQPRDHWSTITSQFGSGAGYPAFRRTVFKGVFHDLRRPPRHTKQSQFAAEANAFARRHHLRDRIDAQVVIATQSGTCPSGFYAHGVCGSTGFYCAYHSVSRVPYVNLPYLLDAGRACGAHAVRSKYDGFSIVGGHEYAETVTDPVPLRGWINPHDPTGGEIGDKCAWQDPVTHRPNSRSVRLSTGLFAMQPLFSNIARARRGDGCAFSNAPGGRITGYHGRCLGNLTPGSSSGTRIGIAKCTGRVGQFWSSRGRTGLSVFGLCLTGGARGSTAVMSTCRGAARQRWQRRRNGELVLSGTRLCLTDAHGSAKSSKVILAVCRGRRTQRWTKI